MRVGRADSTGGCMGTAPWSVAVPASYLRFGYYLAEERALSSLTVRCCRVVVSVGYWTDKTRLVGTGTSAGFWLGGQCPLAAWSEGNFENLTTKWCILEYIFKSFTHMMATKTSWHRYGSKLGHCHLMYTERAASILRVLVCIAIPIMSTVKQTITLSYYCWKTSVDYPVLLSGVLFCSACLPLSARISAC